MLSEMPATIATCFGPAAVNTRPTISGGNSACISRGSLSVLYFHSSCIPFTFDTLRMCSFFCHAVRCGSPPSVSQSASAPSTFARCASADKPVLRRDRSAGDDCAKGNAADMAISVAAIPKCVLIFLLFTFYFLLFTFYFSLFTSTQRKHPHCPAFRHFRIFAWENAVEPGLHRARVDAESRLHSDVLPSVHRKRDRYTDNAGVGRHFPEHLSAFGIERAKPPIVRPAGEHEAAGGRQDRPPVGGLRERMRPHPFARVDVPRLHFTDVLRARIRIQRGSGPAVAAALHVSHLAADQRRAEIFVSWNVNQTCLRIECRRRPVLRAPP